MRITQLSIITLCSVLGFAQTALADFQYNLSEPLPGGTQSVTSFGDYVGQIMPFIISLVIGLAFVMLVFAGIEYASAAGNSNLISDARSRMWAAAGGLLIAALSVLILNTVNPNLTNLDLNRIEQALQNGPNSGGQNGPPGGGQNGPPTSHK